MHVHIQESLLSGRRRKGNFACCSARFLQVFERGFLQKISYFDGKKWPIKTRKITGPNLTYRGSIICQFHCLDIQRPEFFQTPGVFIDSPGTPL